MNGRGTVTSGAIGTVGADAGSAGRTGTARSRRAGAVGESSAGIELGVAVSSNRIVTSRCFGLTVAHSSVRLRKNRSD